jgi:DNA-directed RNA polymerase specialized sigma subunit
MGCSSSLRSAIRNENAAEFYRRYSDNDGDGYDDSGEEYIQDNSSDTEYLYFKSELYSRLMNAYEDLNYEERTMLAERYKNKIPRSSYPAS